MIKEALALQRDSWCRLLTPGIFLPSLGCLRLSTSTTARPLTRTSLRRNKRLESLLPEPGQQLQVQSGRMEEVQQAVIAGVGQAQTPHQAGHARQIGAQAQGGQDDRQPEEGGGA